ncbi:hypothetical protein M9979_06485 [Sphingomonas sp. RP10(2022)]|uniref:Uncharacterized protein n=1 Tax=Sphingomonas liriopis TaxID=2949094 RepID=A0A9X2HNQ5_9SPHN|nr:hypothetical protein [Sphingomonas liriopis]MCP3734521.1 hypothetical protein [Sphingomonas liriopis]
MTLFIAAHLILALVLFFSVNWIGKHAVDFGYQSTTLFEEPDENVALNFFLRAMAPTVFIVAVSAALVATGHPSWRMGIAWVSVYYYGIRCMAIVLLNRQGLISWPRFIGHATAGIAAAFIAQRYLIIPNRSLLPNLDSAGNELWLAIIAFFYAVANKVPLAGGPGARRRNRFVARHYRIIRRRFDALIATETKDSQLQLIIYAVMIYEDYARPPLIRSIERLMFWKKDRTTGIMQVRADHSLSDHESVQRGIHLLADSWAQNAPNESNWERTRDTVSTYNRDDDYISRVFDVMEILAKRVDPSLEPVYDSLLN